MKFPRYIRLGIRLQLIFLVSFVAIFSLMFLAIITGIYFSKNFLTLRSERLSVIAKLKSSQIEQNLQSTYYQLYWIASRDSVQKYIASVSGVNSTNRATSANTLSGDAISYLQKFFDSSDTYIQAKLYDLKLQEVGIVSNNASSYSSNLGSALTSTTLKSSSSHHTKTHSSSSSSATNTLASQSPYSNNTNGTSSIVSQYSRGALESLYILNPNVTTLPSRIIKSGVIRGPVKDPLSGKFIMSMTLPIYPNSSVSSSSGLIAGYATIVYSAEALKSVIYDTSAIDNGKILLLEGGFNTTLTDKGYVSNANNSTKTQGYVVSSNVREATNMIRNKGLSLANFMAKRAESVSSHSKNSTSSTATATSTSTTNSSNTSGTISSTETPKSIVTGYFSSDYINYIRYVFPPLSDSSASLLNMYFKITEYPVVVNCLINEEDGTRKNTNTPDGNNMAVGYGKINSGLVDWAVFVAQENSVFMGPSKKLTEIIVGTVIAVCVFMCLVTFPISHYAARPITRLKEKSEVFSLRNGENVKNVKIKNREPDDDLDGNAAGVSTGRFYRSSKLTKYLALGRLIHRHSRPAVDKTSDGLNTDSYNTSTLKNTSNEKQTPTPLQHDNLNHSLNPSHQFLSETPQVYSEGQTHHDKQIQSDKLDKTQNNVRGNKLSTPTFDNNISDITDKTLKPDDHKAISDEHNKILLPNHDSNDNSRSLTLIKSLPYSHDQLGYTKKDLDDISNKNEKKVAEKGGINILGTLKLNQPNKSFISFFHKKGILAEDLYGEQLVNENKNLSIFNPKRYIVINDELTELSDTFENMSYLIRRQYSDLEDKVRERTRELEKAKVEAERANESKTVFIANISHELKTPLNGILGMCTIAREDLKRLQSYIGQQMEKQKGNSNELSAADPEFDQMMLTDSSNIISNVVESLTLIYKSGDLLSHILNELLTFSKNNLNRTKLEFRKFMLVDVLKQIKSIFVKNAVDARVNFTLTFKGPSDLAQYSRMFICSDLDHAETDEQKYEIITRRMRNFVLLADDNRISQILMNLVSNSLKFTPVNGEVKLEVNLVGQWDEVTSRENNYDDVYIKSVNDFDDGDYASEKRSSVVDTRKPEDDTASINSSVAESVGSFIDELKQELHEKKVRGLFDVGSSGPSNITVQRRKHPMYWVFEFIVTDTGPGISPELQKQVFEPFVQGDQTLSRSYGGTGLGLSICKQLAGLMHGKMSLESQLGKGSKFVFTVPLLQTNEIFWDNKKDETMVFDDEFNVKNNLVKEFCDSKPASVHHQSVKNDIVPIKETDAVLMDDDSDALKAADSMRRTSDLRKVSNQDTDVYGLDLMGVDLKPTRSFGSENSNLKVVPLEGIAKDTQEPNSNFETGEKMSRRPSISSVTSVKRTGSNKSKRNATLTLDQSYFQDKAALLTTSSTGTALSNKFAFSHNAAANKTSHSPGSNNQNPFSILDIHNYIARNKANAEGTSESEWGLHENNVCDGHGDNFLKKPDEESIKNGNASIISQITPPVNGIANTNGTANGKHKLLGEKFPLRILVAEDNLVNQKVAQRLLNLEGFLNISLACDGGEAIDYIQQSLNEYEELVKNNQDTSFVIYDMIFMDIQMPRIDGLAATKFIREKLNFRGPIIALTAFTDDSNVKHCLEQGMDAFLAKPIRRTLLKKLILQHLRSVNGDVVDTVMTPSDEREDE